MTLKFRNILVLVLVSCGVLYASDTAANPPVRIISLTPDTPFINPNGRLLKLLHAARFKIRIENTTNAPQTGTLAAEAIGNLETVYDLGRETVMLAPRENRLMWVYWSYPSDTTYNLSMGTALSAAGASWGHEIRVAWLDAAGRQICHAHDIFAIDHDGLDPNSEPKRTAPVSDAQAFAIRWSGYFKNPAFAPAPAADQMTLAVNGQKINGMLKGKAPSGFETYILKLSPALAGKAVVTFNTDWLRLDGAFLIEPGSLAARRLYHLVDEKQFTFDIPTTKENTLLILEIGKGRYIPPYPLAKRAAEGEKQFGPFASMLRDTEGKEITTPARWRQNRQTLKAIIWKELGVMPVSKDIPFNPVVLSDEKIPQQAWAAGVTRPYTRRKISIQLDKNERINVWLLIPQGIGPFPAVVTCHQTVQEGKDEPLGLGGAYYVLNYAPFLASRGYVVIAADSITVGERFDPDIETPWDTRPLRAKDPNWSLIGERVRDHIRVVDFLATLPFVDVNRIGVMGHSLGGESTAMLAAMDDRIACAVVSCGFTLMRTYDDAGQVYWSEQAAIVSDRWKALLQTPVKDRRLPWDFDNIMSLWAPRPVFHHEVADELWPNAAQVAQAGVELEKLYKFLGAGAGYYMLYSNQGHCFPEWVQPDTYDWLDYWLKGPHNVMINKNLSF